MNKHNIYLGIPSEESLEYADKLLSSLRKEYAIFFDYLVQKWDNPNDKDISEIVSIGKEVIRTHTERLLNLYEDSKKELENLKKV